MTVTYINHVNTSGRCGAFLRLLCFWKGSIYQGVLGDLFLFWILYFGISLLYRFYLSQEEWMKENFEKICVYFGHFDHWIPISFVLGFYVSLVVTRWWQQFCYIPWPDKLSMNLLTFLPGDGERRRVRRYVVRLAHLSSVLVLRMMSLTTRTRFPSLDSLVQAGLMTNSEKVKLEKMNITVQNLHHTTWCPLAWAQVRLRKCYELGWIKSEFFFMELQNNLNEYAFNNGTLICYAWVNIPLAYTQLVTIAVHVYFLVALFGRQYLNPTMFIVKDGGYVSVGQNKTIPGIVNLVGYDTDKIHDFYFPFFTSLEFVFYFGWLKVAEYLINPFGDDADDFDLRYIIDRNFQVGLLMVEGEETEQEMEDDPYGDDIPQVVPRTCKSWQEAQSVPVVVSENSEPVSGESPNIFLKFNNSVLDITGRNQDA